MRNWSLIWHIFLPFLTVIVLSLLLITSYTSRSLRDHFLAQTDSDLQNRAALMVTAVQPLLAEGNLDAMHSFCREHGKSGDIRITVVLPNGRVIGDSHEQPHNMDNHAGRPEIAQALEGNPGQSIRYSTTVRHKQMYLALPIQDGNEVIGVLRAAHSLQTIDDALAVVQDRLTLGGLMLAIAAALISFILARRLSKPLRQMQIGAARFARGRLDMRLATSRGSAEIRALAVSLNSMAGQLAERIEMIEKQRNEQEAVLASMVESVLAIDREQTIIRLNEASCNLLDLDMDTAQGKSLQEVVRNPGLIDLARAALSADEPVEGEIILRREGERHLQVHATSLRGPDSQLLGALLVLNDVTRIRRLESLRKDFVANVSHELRTPITSIKGFVETLLSNPPDDPAAAARFLSIIGRQAERLQAIIDDLLCLSRLEQENGAMALGREQTAAAEILDEAVTLCTARAGSEAPAVRIDCPPDLHVWANPALLEQAVVNLVDNAMKHSGSTGPILLSARREQEHVQIDVSDTGRGIPPEHLPRIFERFYRVDRARSRTLGGTGLGLAIVKHIAQAHGGQVRVSSIPGRGSTFTITLPGNPE
jgi:two-component system, OmpR family, phosphate regulon sensor histidine kinase PhoR